MASTFDSVNPARPAEVIGTYPLHGAADVDRAVDTAAAAQRQWAQVPVPARAEIIAAAGDVLRRRKAELSELVSREGGKILVEAGGDVQEAIDMASFVAGQGRSAWGETVPSELGSKLCWTTRLPVGVVGMITPWNFPVAIPSWKCFPALLAGNGIVLKPSEHAPALCRGVRRGCVEPRACRPTSSSSCTASPSPAAALAVHPGVGAVSFTGSRADRPQGGGRGDGDRSPARVARARRQERHGRAEPTPTSTSWSTARSSARSARPASAARRPPGSSSTPTSPTSWSARIVERVKALRLGDPAEAGTDVGPVITADSAERIVAVIDAAVAEGAELRSAGGSALDVEGCAGGTFVEPTVLAGVKPADRIAREEVFGPVLAVLEVADLDEAIDVVNSVEYGLSAAIYTPDINAALRAVDRINTGIVYVNAPTIGAEIPLPFGGTKHTGNGFREAGSPGHRAVQPSEDRVHRLLRPPAEGPDRQPHPMGDQ